MTLGYIPDDSRIQHIHYRFSRLGIFEVAKPLVLTAEIQIVCEETRSRCRRHMEACQEYEKHSRTRIESFVYDCYFQLFLTKYSFE